MSGAIPPGGGSALADIIALRQQVIDRSEALQGLRQGSSKPSEPAGSAGSNFADTLTQALSSVNATQAKASQISEAYERGEVADVAQVMLARQEAGLAFEATLQVRNKLLSAYQDVMRMGL